MDRLTPGRIGKVVDAHKLNDTQGDAATKFALDVINMMVEPICQLQKPHACWNCLRICGMTCAHYRTRPMPDKQSPTVNSGFNTSREFAGI